ncbi:hypothetical protein [Brassicibacter mesophilus]|uniref:hypothetical protein n=1 Tax=Brassicibacter mesophilus TaxID=745119 RepID=UPI003D243295
MKNKILYEVETRFYFKNQEEAFKILPFLHSCLKKATEFETKMYGVKLFNAGKILRVSNVSKYNTTRVYLGYKEPDVGRIFNVRNEIDEEITDETNESCILKSYLGRNNQVNKRNINKLLESLGHRHFMSIIGTNITGYNEELQIDFKLMKSPVLKYPLLLEIEKSADTLEEAFRQELALKDFITEYKLEDRIVKEEPPSLLSSYK